MRFLIFALLLGCGNDRVEHHYHDTKYCGYSYDLGCYACEYVIGNNVYLKCE